MHSRETPVDSTARTVSARSEVRVRRRVMMQLAVEWTVTECCGEHVPGARGSRCLIFASAEAIRRVWDVPADWYALPDAALFALSWRR